MIVRPSAWVLAIAVVVAGCGGQRGQARAAPAPLRVTGEPESLRFSSPLGVDLQFMRRTPSGLYYLDSQIGKGPAAAHGNRVKVAYQGWLADGKLFDSSDDGFQFLLGRGQVIPGWDEGVEGMRLGDAGFSSFGHPWRMDDRAPARGSRPMPRWCSMFTCLVSPHKAWHQSPSRRAGPLPSFSLF